MANGQKQTLTNVELRDVVQSKQGQGQHGAWTLYKFGVRLQGWENETITYFKSGNKPTPQDGMMIASMDIEEDYYQGQFRGYKTSALMVAGSGASPKPFQPKPKPRGLSEAPTPRKQDAGPITMWTSYAKDIIVALINAGMLDDNIKVNVQRLMGVATSCGGNALRDATALLDPSMSDFEKVTRQAAGSDAPRPTPPISDGSMPDDPFEETMIPDSIEEILDGDGNPVPF
ncbi:hypothetical protein ACFL3R_00715 [Thermodesulfobacteriota bacterium]